MQNVAIEIRFPNARHGSVVFKLYTILIMRVGNSPYILHIFIICILLHAISFVFSPPDLRFVLCKTVLIDKREKQKKNFIRGMTIKLISTMTMSVCMYVNMRYMLFICLTMHSFVCVYKFSFHFLLLIALNLMH